MRFHFLHTHIWRLLLPVVVSGTLLSLLLGFYLIPPLISSMQKRIDRTISHTVSMAMKICEERFNDMIDLRMEENVEMNIAAKREAVEEIKEVATIFPDVRMVIFDTTGVIQGASFTLPQKRSQGLLKTFEQMEPLRNIHRAELLGEEVLLDHSYFPFWRWHIVSYIPQKEYDEPIGMAKRIVFFGNFGTLVAVAASVILFFTITINRPLRKIIATTRKVRQGDFERVNLQVSGEIGQVAVAFDDMIDKLEHDRLHINRILEELSESEEKYRILSENSLTLVFVLDRNRFRYANHAAAAFFGWAEEGLHGLEVDAVIGGSSAQLLKERIEALLDHGSMREHFELRHRANDSSDKWLEVLASPITYQGKAAVLIHALDITQRKKMEQERESLQQKINRGEQMEMLGTLAGGVAHDLNNILSGIASYPELLLQQVDEHSPLHRPLHIIHQSGQKAAAIVQDLLTLTRRGVVISEVVDIRSIIEEYLNSPELASLLDFYPDIHITTHYGENIMNIKGSPHHLSKSIMNLVTNAAEAMPEGGKIHIEVVNRYNDVPAGDVDAPREGAYVAVAVSDSGQGISENDLGKIFEPFYTRKIMGRSGTGLGMSVVWGTIKDHKGHIEVESTQGDGTTFTLLFPACPDAVTGDPQPPLLLHGEGMGKRILVVDDIEDQRHIASSMLTHLGYEVDTAASGEAALEMIRAGLSYELILLDMIMEPGMDGLDTYREILAIQPEQKVVFASGFSETLRVRQALKLGNGTYLKKPYGLSGLRSAISSVLRMRN